MTPQDMVARYAQAVARRLPKPMRADVHAELQELLIDSLRERADGGAPTEQMARDLLMSFGAPRDVALRYHAPTPIIDPADTRLFSKVALGTLLAFAVLAAGIIASAPHATQAEWQGIATGVTRDYVTAALQILGLLLVLFWQWGNARRTYPALMAWKPSGLPAVRDPDQINRLGNVAALGGWSLGLLILMRPVAAFDVLWGGHSPAALHQAFAYNEDFSSMRAPVLWALLVANLLLYALATVEGRWRKLTRRIGLGLAAATCVVMMWVIVAGAIFEAAPTDQAMKFWMAIISGISLLDLWKRIEDERGLHTAPPMAGISASP